MPSEREPAVPYYVPILCATTAQHEVAACVHSGKLWEVRRRAGRVYAVRQADGTWKCGGCGAKVLAAW